jgi:hypothetical protein
VPHKNIVVEAFMKIRVTIILLLIFPGIAICGQLETKFGPILFETNEQIIDYGQSLVPKEYPELHLRPLTLEAIISRHEKIFTEVCAKLDINLNGIKTKIRIVDSLEQLHVEYKRYVPHSEKSVTSFYSHRDKTIWYSPERLSHGIILHETAHAIMDHYFIRPIPAGVDELVSEMLEQTN